MYGNFIKKNKPLYLFLKDLSFLSSPSYTKNFT